MFRLIATFSLLSAASVTAMTGCSEERPEPNAGTAFGGDAPWQAPLYTGCDSVLRGPICLLPGRAPVHLWVPLTSGELVVRGGELTQRQPVDGGLYLTVIPTHLPGTLEVLTPAGAQAPRPRWRLHLANSAAIEPALTQARALRRERRFDDAIATLATVSAATSPSPRAALARAYASHWAGLAHLADGDSQGALTRLHRATQQYAEEGDRPQALIDAATVAVYLHLQRSEFAEAGRLIAQIRPAPATAAMLGAEGQYLLDYYTGALASLVGDYRNALIHLTRAASIARRAQLHGRQHLAEQWLALQLQAVGRRDEADALLMTLASRHSTRSGPCAKAQLATNIAWNRLLALEAHHPASDPRPPLREALAAYQAPACNATREQLVNVRINLSLAHLHAGELDASARLLSTLRSEGDITPALALWLHDAEGRVALHRHDATGALAAYDALTHLALQRYDDQARWRAEAGRAQSLQQLGDTAGALEAYARAEQLLAQQTMQVPVNAGRDTFLARHGWVTSAYLQLLLAEGHEGEAFAVARTVRSRALRSLRRADRLAALNTQERARWQDAMTRYVRTRDQLAAHASEDWMLPADALAPTRTARQALALALRTTLDEAFEVLDRTTPQQPEERPRPQGETQLLYLAITGNSTAPKRWLAFASSDLGIQAQVLGCPPPAMTGAELISTSRARTLSDCLLQPFAAHIDAATHLRILPSGVLSNLDLHALPWAGAPLLAHAPVSYALDAPGDGKRTPTASPSARLLVVADPRGDLPAARQEAQHVATLLRQQHRENPRMLLGEAASLGRLREALEQADLFHYAGHAVFGGRGGWDSTLPLAGEDTFTVGDILALRRAPTQVVLSGCETGRSEQATGSTQGIGIAHAFLAAGSRSVIAAVRPVEDATANALVSALYERWHEGAHPAQALRAAQLSLAQQAPQEDWFSFRHMAL